MIRWVWSDNALMLDVARAVAQAQASLDEPAGPGEATCDFIWRLRNGELVPCQSRRAWEVSILMVGLKRVCLTHAEYLELAQHGRIIGPIRDQSRVERLWLWVKRRRHG